VLGSIRPRTNDPSNALAHGTVAQRPAHLAGPKVERRPACPAQRLGPTARWPTTVGVFGTHDAAGCVVTAATAGIVARLAPVERQLISDEVDARTTMEARQTWRAGRGLTGMKGQ
jgi:hypothetical protein